MKFDKEDLMYCMDKMYEQSGKAPDESPIHIDRFNVLRKVVADALDTTPLHDDIVGIIADKNIQRHSFPESPESQLLADKADDIFESLKSKLSLELQKELLAYSDAESYHQAEAMAKAFSDGFKAGIQSK